MQCVDKSTGEFMSESYTRNFSMPHASPAAAAARDSTIPRFHIEAVPNPVSSAAAGRPIYDPEERVQIIQPGNPNSPVLKVTEEHKQRWPEHYARLRQGEDFKGDGTPLEQWAFLKKTMVMELKALNIHTIEQCAGLSDLACQNIGMGGREMRENAKAYLDEAAAMAITSAAIADREAAQSQVASLQKQLDELRPMLEKLFTENMALKNLAPPSQTFIPGMNDPIQAAMQAQPMPVTESSLAGLAGTRRPRGRPPANPETAHGT